MTSISFTRSFLIIGLILSPLLWHKEADAQVWKYEKSNDQLRSQTREIATVRSKNTANIGTPYGVIGADLIVRLKDREIIEILISVDRGQIMNCNSFGYNVILAKFDDHPAQSFSCSEPSDRSSNVIFVSPSEDFYQNIKEGRNLIIELTFFQGGVHQFSFNVSGLKLPSIDEIKAARIQKAEEQIELTRQKTIDVISQSKQQSFEGMKTTGRIGDWWAIGSWARSDDPNSCNLILSFDRVTPLYPPTFVKNTSDFIEEDWGYINMNIVTKNKTYENGALFRVNETSIDGFKADIFQFGSVVLSYPDTLLIEKDVNFVRCM